MNAAARVTRGGALVLAAALVAVVAAPAPRAAAAAPAARHKVGARFFLDGAFGVTFPIADSAYRGSYFPSPELSLRLGAELWFSRHFGIAPEGAIDIVPVIDSVRGDVDFTRLRLLFGLRVLFGFGRGHAFFLRGVLGAEAWFFVDRGGVVRGNIVAFVFEPGLGLQFHVARHMVVGFAADFPVVPHDYAPSRVQVDADLLFFLGLRVP
jgi:hypothetical protein